MHATFYLTRGLSSRFARVLRSTEFPRVLTIGAGLHCDWQIHAPGVAQHALSVAFMGDTLYAISGPDAFVTSDGVLLREAWQELPRPARLRLGAAELTVDSHEEANSEREPFQERDVEPRNEGERTMTQRRCSYVPPVDIASLLGSDAAPPRERQHLLRATGFILLTAIAYHTWLFVLDQL